MLEAVLPFQCEECGLQVSPSGGGMCFGCSRMLCAEHFVLRPPDRDSAKRPEYECRRCQLREAERTRET